MFILLCRCEVVIPGGDFEQIHLGVVWIQDLEEKEGLDLWMEINLGGFY